jgi:hypothetical protein
MVAPSLAFANPAARYSVERRPKRIIHGVRDSDPNPSQLASFAQQRSDMADFCFVHAADIHLDSPLHGPSRYNGVPADDIRGATPNAFDNLIRFALDKAVDFVLIAGDAFDGTRPSAAQRSMSPPLILPQQPRSSCRSAPNSASTNRAT